MTRKFEDRMAVMSKTPLLVGLVGPSGTGKTNSALRLAAGIQQVTGGDVFMVDSEARRGLHYADQFRFRHVPFAPPFGPLDYLAALEYCVGRGASVVIVDSASHEHEGPGGVLEMHEQELDRIAGQDWGKRKACTFLAWGKPKGERRRLINAVLQMDCNFVFCFRAKPKLELKRGQEPLELGYQAISGDEFLYEMTVNFLLLPGASGVPTLRSDYPGEEALIKLPHQFRRQSRPLFPDGPSQLCEEHGKAMALWAQGSDESVRLLLEAYEGCASREEFERLEARRREAWEKTGRPDQKRLKTASDAAGKRCAAPPQGNTPRGDTEDRPLGADTRALILKLFNDLGMEFEDSRAVFESCGIEDDAAMTEAQGLLVLNKLHALQAQRVGAY